MPIESLRDITRSVRSAFPTIASSSSTVAIPAALAYTTGGTNLAAQIAAAGAAWRVQAFGTFIAASSATARNALVAPFWGTTQLPGISAAVLASVAQTTAWNIEFIVSTTTTVAAWTNGILSSRVSSATLVAMGLNTPASTVIVAGALALDLRFAVSAVVAGDSWSVHNVAIERIK